MGETSIPLGEWSGSAATRELQKTIAQFNVEANRQTGALIGLTRAIAWLTGLLVLLTVALIWIELRRP